MNPMSVLNWNPILIHHIYLGWTYLMFWEDLEIVPDELGEVAFVLGVGFVHGDG